MRCDRTIYFVVSEYSTKHYYLKDCLVFANLFLTMYCMIKNLKGENLGELGQL